MENVLKNQDLKARCREQIFNYWSGSFTTYRSFQVFYFFLIGDIFLENLSISPKFWIDKIIHNVLLF